MNLQLEKYSFLRKNRYYKFIRDIIVPFFFKLVSKCIPKKIDNNLIIIGAYAGNAYLDNAKYLFEYLNKYTNYKVIWIAKSRSLIEQLRKKGYSAFHALNFNSIRLLRKSKYVFITHGIYDLVPIEFSPESKVILTWHGTPLKRIVLDLDDEYYVYTKWGKFFKLKLRYNDYLDYILTPTRDKLEHKYLAKAFRVPLNKILALGYPRNDILIERDGNFVNKLKMKYNIPEKIKRVILYCPTFRDDHTLRLDVTPEELDDLNMLLRDTNSLFLVKGHYFVENTNFEGYNYIKIVPKTVDIQELYLITDILITDYSSTMLDFSLLDRPILLFPYDLEKYEKNTGLYYELEDIAPGPLLYTFRDLINAIENIEEIKQKYEKKRIAIRNRFNKYLDGKSTERILDFLGIKHK